MERIEVEQQTICIYVPSLVVRHDVSTNAKVCVSDVQYVTRLMQTTSTSLFRRRLELIQHVNSTLPDFSSPYHFSPTRRHVQPDVVCYG